MAPDTNDSFSSTTSAKSIIESDFPTVSVAGWLFDNQTTTTNASVARSVAILFESWIIFNGILGIISNGIVIWILVAARIKTGRLKKTNIFLINQLAIDWFSCVWLVITYAWKLGRYKLQGFGSVLMCFFIESEGLLWVGMNGSVINLVCITLERYVKIIHPLFNRKYHRKWIDRICVAFVWISGILLTLPADWVASNFKSGNCRAYSNWSSVQDGLGYGIFYIFVTFILPLILFVYCYWKILVVIRKTGKISDNADEKTNRKGASSPDQGNSHRAEYSLLKTMVTITVLFAVCWFPSNVYFLLLNSECCSGLSINSDAWYGTLFAAFLTNSIHPFLYGSKIESVKIFIQNVPLLRCYR